MGLFVRVCVYVIMIQEIVQKKETGIGIETLIGSEGREEERAEENKEKKSTGSIEALIECDWSR